jgi:hypothetical protein
MFILLVAGWSWFYPEPTVKRPPDRFGENRGYPGDED